MAQQVLPRIIQDGLLEILVPVTIMLNGGTEAAIVPEKLIGVRTYPPFTLTQIVAFLLPTDACGTCAAPFREWEEGGVLALLLLGQPLLPLLEQFFEMKTQIMRELRVFNVCLTLRAKNFGHKPPYVGGVR